MTIGERIRFFRKEQGLTQDDLARKMGIKRGTLAQYESDRRNPKLETLEKISGALGVEIGKLCGLSSLDDILKVADPDAKEDLYKIAGVAAQNINIQGQREELESAFDKLNNIGREEAVKRVQELTRLSKYSYNLHDEVEWAADVLEDAHDAAGPAADGATIDEPKE